MVVNEKFGGNGSIISIHKDPSFPYKSEGGFLKDKAINYLRDFYSVGNAHAPENKRQRKIICIKYFINKIFIIYSSYIKFYMAINIINLLININSKKKN